VKLGEYIEEEDTDDIAIASDLCAELEELASEVTVLWETLGLTMHQENVPKPVPPMQSKMAHRIRELHLLMHTTRHKVETITEMANEVLGMLGDPDTLGDAEPHSGR
jgi:hypothetical protein